MKVNNWNVSKFEWPNFFNNFFDAVFEVIFIVKIDIQKYVADIDNVFQRWVRWPAGGNGATACNASQNCLGSLNRGRLDAAMGSEQCMLSANLILQITLAE